MSIFTRWADKTGSFGAVIAAMGCASCFSGDCRLGSALGLGFLGRYEGVFINTLLPIFAAIALVSNALAWFSHRQWRSTLLGLAGPAIGARDVVPVLNRELEHILFLYRHRADAGCFDMGSRAPCTAFKL